MLALSTASSWMFPLPMDTYEDSDTQYLLLKLAFPVFPRKPL